MPMSFERSPDTESVINVLRGCNSDITYFDLSKRAGLGVGRMKQVLASARKALSREGILFGVIYNVGLKRLTDHDIVKKPEAFKKRVFRGAGRELKDLGKINDFGALSKTEQHSVTLNRTILGAIRQSAFVKPDKIVSVKAAPLPDVSKLAAMRKE
jgi:hypothetical protein